MSISQGNNHKLQFIINDHVLPYSMTVFQAIQQFSQDSADSDSELTVGSTHLFQRTHTIYYRSVARGAGGATLSLAGVGLVRTCFEMCQKIHRLALTVTKGTEGAWLAGVSTLHRLHCDCLNTAIVSNDKCPAFHATAIFGSTFRRVREIRQANETGKLL